MLINILMEGETIASDNLISPIKHLNSDGKEHGTIKALLRNFILPESDKMAIKENQSDNSKCVYTVPIKPPPCTRNDRTKTINEAKQAFLNSTVDKTVRLRRNDVNSKEPTLHYAQIAITTESEDTRSTGGGKDEKQSSNKSISSTDIPLNIKKKIEQQQRKVSFKIKTVSTSYKRQSLATKSTVTITSSKVSELTKKFNDLMKESHDKTKKQTKLAMTIEDLQSVTRRSPSNNSTPSSTLSSSPNIKILVRQRRGSKKRNSRKRCSSVDSIDKLLLSDNTSAKICVIRSKSDGTKAPKSPKKRLKQQITNEEVKGFDDVDGNPTKIIDTKSTKSIEKKASENNVVKSVIKKFESEITAQSNSNNTLRKHPEHNKQPAVIKEKPKVPEKKSSLVLTKNLVVKDGVPKIKTIKPVLSESLPKQDNNLVILKKKEPLYDKKKYKTNYIHSDKMSLHVVEIIQEDISENLVSTTEKPNNIVDSLKPIEEKNSNEPDITVVNTNEMEVEGTTYQEISSPLAPNESFLWRRKNSTQIYSDSEKSMSDTYSPFVSLTVNETSIVISEESQISDKIESHDISGSDVKVDLISHEDSLIEAYNKDVLVELTPKPEKAQVMEDDYEVLEPRNPEEIVVVPVKSENRNSKINCPLPEIPKEETPASPEKDGKENIYQCLLEMRSHPEGDESSLHSYELCNNHLEERTRGDGDSDDGYEYCKSPIKPYCMTSSSGIQIAEDYQPNCPNNNDKNYAISKSVSGTSTISYEKIGCDRIYEKIPCETPKSKESSPNYSKRHSYVSSDYTTYNDTENIYDTIKHADGTSLSHCYESIPNSPSMVKLRNNLKKQLNSTVQKRLSFDTVSNISQSTLSSEQKTNSIYGQRSMISYNGQEIAFQVPSSETSVSDRSDRSDDWVDVSDEEKNDEQKIIIVREKSRGRKSPVSWSQKVRHQWQKTPKQPKDNNDCDSSDSGHLYESLELAPAPPAVSAPPMHPAPPPLPYEEDTDSFDSDSDYDEHEKSTQRPPSPLLNSRLPSPPSAGGQHTLTKIANAAQRKMKQIKRNLTKRYSVAMDGKSFIKSSSTNPSNGVYGTTATKSKTKTPIYANCEKPDTQHVYTNVNFNETRPAINKTENPVAKANGSFKEELKNVIGEKRPGSGDVPPPLPEKPPPEKPTTPTSENSKKDSGTLSRKTYFSFKSRFRRASSLAIDASSEVPSALKITNSTFYLTDSIDGDSGFSNCSDSGQPGSTETLSPGAQARRRDGRLRPGWAESSPCLAPLERPSVPPPPPPTDLSAVNEELKRLLPTLSRKDKAPRARTSWYAECGADSTPASASNASWYAEAGLYQAGNISSSSGASSGSHPGSPLPHSLFTHEPLYQFYNAAKVESVCRETGDSDSEAYEAGSSGGSQSRASPAPAARPSAMALVAPRGPARTLWCEVPEVLNSAVLSSLAPAQKRLQEAKFELLTSEASYLNSLNVLEAHFISHPAFRDPHVLPPADWETLFATILPVRKCSQQLMAELERCWQENILLAGICDIVRAHAEKHFHVYVKYCENQALMVRALQRLRDRPAFAAALKRLESAPACQSLSLHSFLMLPMQRVTRLPLLLDAVLKNLSDGDDEYQSCMHALATLNDFVSQCNEGARNTERVEEMFRLAQRVEFPAGVRNPPALGPACSRRDRQPVRWLVRSGEVIQLLWKTDELKLTFGKKFHKVPLHLFLFNDLLVITKKKGEESYIAVDHCSRSLLEVCASEATAGAKHALLLTLLENHEGRTLEMLVSCPSETDASRWAEALAPPPAGAGEAVYAGWDCPQVAALYAYAPTQPDELALSEGDVVNVTRKTSEGWYYGERTRDGEAGWFPGAYTAEIASAHVRARNLRQRYRLLALSGTYLGQKKRPT